MGPGVIERDTCNIFWDQGASDSSSYIATFQLLEQPTFERGLLFPCEMCMTETTTIERGHSRQLLGYALV